MKLSAEALAAADEARRWGAIHIQYEIGGKHIKVRFRYKGVWHMTVHPQSGSDRRGPMNARKDVRRVIGLVRPAKKGKRRQHKNAAPPRPAEIPTITPGRDCRDEFKMAYLKSLPIDDVWRLWFRGIMERVAA